MLILNIILLIIYMLLLLIDNYVLNYYKNILILWNNIANRLWVDSRVVLGLVRDLELGIGKYCRHFPSVLVYLRLLNYSFYFNRGLEWH